MSTPTAIRAAGFALGLLWLAAALHPAWSAALPPGSPPAIPLIKGLTVTGAASERQGDYESTITIESVDADGSLHLTTASELPDPNGGPRRPVSFTRDVRAVDLKAARSYRYLFSDGEVEYPGTTAMGTSAIVIAELRSQGKASVTLDGRAGGLAGLVTGMLGMLQGASGNDADPKSKGGGYLTASGALEVIEPRPLPFPIIVNDVPVSLPAWHVRGRFVQNGSPVPVEWYILDDPSNAMTLRFTIGTEHLDIVRIAYPVVNEAASLETALAKERRAVLYGIYFDFNSATIKPQSESVLRTIVEVMKRESSWVLNIEGHTDNVGGDTGNQALSASRAAAVKQALVERGVSATRLNTSGFGASAPRETNATLQGRARNRRVELTRS